MGQALLCRGRCPLRGLALCGLCGAHAAPVKRSNQFLPVTRPLSYTGEREYVPSLRKAAMRQLGRLFGRRC